MPKNTLEDNTYILPEYTVYPYNANLTTIYPFNQTYLIGHSALNLNTSDPSLGSTSINTTTKDKGYNVVCNNCSDDTRRVLEAAFKKKANPILFTTPGDVKDFFIENGAIENKNKSSRKTIKRHHISLTKEQYINALNEAKNIRYKQGRDKTKIRYSLAD